MDATKPNDVAVTLPVSRFPSKRFYRGIPFSSHAYTYGPSGNIRSWEQTTGASPAKKWGIAYDRADQLEAATLTDTSAAVLEQHAWRYDKIGNRTSRQNGLQITGSTHNNRNQIVSEQPGGWMRVRGTTDEPATVKVRSNANPFTSAATTAENAFSGWVTTTPGANSITIEARDTSPSAPPTTNTYTVNVTGTSRTPAYDLNGNTTANGTGQTYEWDAENRLIKIIYVDNSSTAFTYDGYSRRVRITERNAANAVISDKRYVWAGGNQPAEERDAAGTTVLRQYHSQGEFIPAATVPLNKLFYTKDHLGSVRELVDGSGTLQTRYDYDMWGKRVKLSGSIDSDVGYTGHHHHAKSGLILTWYRAYDAELGRWLSADPIGEEGGINLYGYVGGNPVNYSDPFGLYIGAPGGEVWHPLSREGTAEQRKKWGDRAAMTAAAVCAGSAAPTAAAVVATRAQPLYLAAIMAMDSTGVVGGGTGTVHALSWWAISERQLQSQEGLIPRRLRRMRGKKNSEYPAACRGDLYWCPGTCDAGAWKFSE